MELYLLTLNVYLHHDPESPLLGVNPTKPSALVYNETCIKMNTATLFIVDPTGKNPCPWAVE